MSTRSRAHPWFASGPKVGSVYVTGEPTFVGELPIRTEIQVIPEGPLTIKGWTCQVYFGAEVAKKSNPGVNLTQESDLQPGDEVIVPNLFGRCLMVVARDKDGGLYAENKGLTSDLLFNNDDRHCWVTTHTMNRDALEKVRHFG